jgi:DNA helicase IV
LIRLQQRPLLGFLIDPFGTSARAMALDGDYIRITRRGQVALVSLQALTHAPALRKGVLGTALTINSQEHNDVTLKGAGHVAAREFAEEVKEAWTRVNLSALEKEAARLDRVLAGVLGLAAPPQYPSACTIGPLMDDAKALDASLLSKLNADAIGPRSRRASHRSVNSPPPREQHGRMPSPPSSRPNWTAGRISLTRSRASR